MKCHPHPGVQRHDASLTFGQRSAETLASFIGSWRFLIVQSCILSIWITLNIVAFVHHWDPYPFILLNLCLSFQAAYTGPVLLISSNRQNARDREILAEEWQATQAMAEVLDVLHKLQDENNLWTEAIHKHILEE